MKKLENKIINKIYRMETKRTTGFLMVKTIIVTVFSIILLIFSSALIDILKEQQSFDLLFILKEDLAVLGKYFPENFYDFYLELPQPLTFILIGSILLFGLTFLIFLKNFGKIKNKIFSIYKFYKKNL